MMYGITWEVLGISLKIAKTCKVNLSWIDMYTESQRDWLENPYGEVGRSQTSSTVRPLKSYLPIISFPPESETERFYYVFNAR